MGTPFIAAMVGARLVLPGPHLDGDSLLQLLAAEKVTVGFGVPVIWAGLLAAMRRTEVRLPEFKRALVGGSALPPSMAEAFQRDYGIALTHAWGMTETSPIGTINTPLSNMTRSRHRSSKSSAPVSGPFSASNCRWWTWMANRCPGMVKARGICRSEGTGW